MYELKAFGSVSTLACVGNVGIFTFSIILESFCDDIQEQQYK